MHQDEHFYYDFENPLSDHRIFDSSTFYLMASWCINLIFQISQPLNLMRHWDDEEGFKRKVL